MLCAINERYIFYEKQVMLVKKQVQIASDFQQVVLLLSFVIVNYQLIVADKADKVMHFIIICLITISMEIATDKETNCQRTAGKYAAMTVMWCYLETTKEINSRDKYDINGKINSPSSLSWKFCYQNLSRFDSANFGYPSLGAPAFCCYLMAPDRKEFVEVCKTLNEVQRNVTCNLEQISTLTIKATRAHIDHNRVVSLQPSQATLL
ncbi:hypothetical protein GQX74_010554 [Glossina fuscipes]|nr:hypothetical protein GQX74_010554 [Glossina fuscipes]